MAVIRKNILKDTIVRDKYISGVKSLKQEDSGSTTADFGIPGPTVPVSTYDLFVIWHDRAMNTQTPPGNPFDRNAAHRGPVFLPWHRVMLLVLEQNLQRVLQDPDFGLPYWDWATDGDKPPADQPGTRIWEQDYMGGQGNPVQTGPFAFQPNDPLAWRVRIAANSMGMLNSVNRGLRRGFAVSGAPSLPKTQHVNNALQLHPYDAPEWDVVSDGFRNRVEGWTSDPGSSPPWLHNCVHVWVGGDMLLSTSPNDPVFYLNHCNEDRVWECWMQSNGREYLPDMTAAPDLAGHRIDDTIAAPPGASATPREVLDVGAIYKYDVLQ